MKKIKVSTINNAKGYQQFQQNVNIMQARRKGIIELSKKLETETDEAKKSSGKEALEKALAKLNEDNVTMAKTYGYSLTRNYTAEVEKAKVLLVLKKEELEALEKAKKKPELIVQGKATLVEIATINTVEENERFMKFTRIMQAKLKNARELQAKFKSAGETEKEEAKKQLDKALENLNENNKIMQKNYGFNIVRNYVYQPEKVNLYLNQPEESEKA